MNTQRYTTSAIPAHKIPLGSTVMHLKGHTKYKLTDTCPTNFRDGADKPLKHLAEDRLFLVGPTGAAYSIHKNHKMLWLVSEMVSSIPPRQEPSLDRSAAYHKAVEAILERTKKSWLKPDIQRVYRYRTGWFGRQILQTRLARPSDAVFHSDESWRDAHEHETPCRTFTHINLPSYSS